MQCDQYREQLELMANANVERGIFAKLRQHLKQCAVCRQNFAQLKRLDLLMQQKMNDITPPPYLAAQVSTRIGIKARKSANHNKLSYPLAHDGDSRRHLNIDKLI